MKKNTILILLLMIIFQSYSWALDSFLIRDINLGLQYSSLIENRGVIIYRDFQLDPIIDFKFINENWEFVGDAISFKNFLISDQLMVRSRLVAIHNGPFFPVNTTIKNKFPLRKQSFEWSNRLEYYFPTYHQNYIGELALEYDRDLITYHGNYAAVEGQLKLFTFKLLEPNLFVTLGAGDMKNNNYYYGKGSHRFGITDFSTGVNLQIPEFVDRFYTLAKFYYFKVLGNQNQNAQFAINQNASFAFSLTLTKDID